MFGGSSLGSGYRRAHRHTARLRVRPRNLARSLGASPSKSHLRRFHPCWACHVRGSRPGRETPKPSTGRDDQSVASNPAIPMPQHSSNRGDEVLQQQSVGIDLAAGWQLVRLTIWPPSAPSGNCGFPVDVTAETRYVEGLQQYVFTPDEGHAHSGAVGRRRSGSRVRAGHLPAGDCQHCDEQRNNRLGDFSDRRAGLRRSRDRRSARKFARLQQVQETGLIEHRDSRLLGLRDL